MSLSGTIKQHDGVFVASLLGKPEISAQRDTREAAINAPERARATRSLPMSLKKSTLSAIDSAMNGSEKSTRSKINRVSVLKLATPRKSTPGP